LGGPCGRTGVPPSNAGLASSFFILHFSFFISFVLAFLQPGDLFLKHALHLLALKTVRLRPAASSDGTRRGCAGRICEQNRSRPPDPRRLSAAVPAN
jgi:hypothetical protein